MANRVTTTITPADLVPDPAQEQLLVELRLNDRRRTFVLQFVVCRCARTAAIRAGYSQRSARQQGTRLLADKRVKTAIDQLSKSAAARAGIDATIVFQGLLKEARGESADSTAAVRVRAWETIARLIGMERETGPAPAATPRPEVGYRDPKTMTDEELHEELTQLAVV